MRRRLSTALRVAFGLGGVVFMVVAFVRTWDRSQGMPLPSPAVLLLALLAAAASPVAGFMAWSEVLHRRPTRSLASGFFTAQLGKYVPGGIWQAVGQVGYAVRDAIGVGKAASAFVVNSIAQAVAGLLIGALLVVTGPSLTDLQRAGVAAVTLTAALLYRPVLVRAVRLLRRWTGRGAGTGLVPSQQAILASLLYNVASLIAAGTAFALLLADAGGGWTLGAIPAFSLAWSLGFLVVPFPAGLGIREAVLVATLDVTAATVIAASVFLRLLVIVGEAVLVVLSRLAERIGDDDRIRDDPAPDRSP